MSLNFNRLLCWHWDQVSSFPHLCHWWQGSLKHPLFPLPQWNHLQPELLHLWLVVQLWLLWGGGTLLTQWQDCSWTWRASWCLVQCIVYLFSSWPCSGKPFGRIWRKQSWTFKTWLKMSIKWLLLTYFVT
jgi:hypothetical protein